MAKKSETINSSIFFTFKVSEHSGTNVLFISSPGAGKSKSIEMLAKMRGYELITLRGSTLTESEVMGFDAIEVDKETGENHIRHCRPSWFSRLLRNHEAGKRTVLFLDELLSCSPLVQSAMLSLVLDRMVDAEPLPESTIIVSCSNPINSQTSDFQCLSAMYNRFCLFNLTCEDSTLDEFLCTYEGASTGNMKNLIETRMEMLQRMDAQMLDIDEDMKNRIGEYFEKCIKETARSLMKGGEKVLDLNCTETQQIYQSQEDDFMYGFISLRTLYFLSKMTLSTYLCFGKDGIRSDNFKKIIAGLVGIALSRKNGDVVKTKVADNFYQSIVQTLSSIDKLSNTKIKTYEDFFNRVVNKDGKNKNTLSQEEITAILGKFQEMKNDTEIREVTKPLEDSVILRLCDMVKHMSVNILKFKIDQKTDIKNTLTPEIVTGMISKWNYMSDIYREIYGVTSNPNCSYPKGINEKVSTIKNELTSDYMKLSSYCRVVGSSYPEFKDIVPEIRKP